MCQTPCVLSLSDSSMQANGVDMFLDSLPSGKETGIEKDSRAHTGGK